MLIDANLLLYAVDSDSPFNEWARDWLTAALNGERRVALPWQTIGAFVRLSTHPRVAAHPLTSAQAWAFVTAWIEAPASWVPPITDRTVTLFGELVARHRVTGNLVTDAQLVAQAQEIGATIYSADTDFERFPEVRWINPLV